MLVLSLDRPVGTEIKLCPSLGLLSDPLPYFLTPEIKSLKKSTHIPSHSYNSFNFTGPHWSRPRSASVIIPSKQALS